MRVAHRLIPGWLSDYHRTSREGITSALAVVPLILMYGIGLIFASPAARSGVDPISSELRLRLSADAYVGVQLGLVALILLVAAWRLRRATGRRLALMGPVVAESAFYGAFMGGAIMWLLDRARTLSTSGATVGWLDRTVTAAGAGLHEELVFRLLLIPALAALFSHGFQLPRALAVTIAVAASSLAFAAAHHLAGEPFELHAFAYRTVAGLLFAGLLLTRGFGVAAWTHAAYDFYVLGL